MNEAETRAELIDPALKEAGWGVVDGSRIRREVIAPGRLQGGGRRGKSEIADYVLVYKNQKLAVIEAKRRSLSVGEGVAQAKAYADKLRTRFSYTSNGEAIYQIDMQSGAEGSVARFPKGAAYQRRGGGVARIAGNHRRSRKPFRRLRQTPPATDRLRGVKPEWRSLHLHQRAPVQQPLRSSGLGLRPGLQWQGILEGWGRQNAQTD